MLIKNVGNISHTDHTNSHLTNFIKIDLSLNLKIRKSLINFSFLGGNIGEIRES